MISIISSLFEYDTAQQFANTNLFQKAKQDEAAKKEIEEAARRAANKAVPKPDIENFAKAPKEMAEKEINASKLREADANEAKEIYNKSSKMVNTDHSDIKTQIVKNKGKVIKKVAQEQPGVAPKTTSALDDLGSATRKIGSNIKQGAETGISAVGKGIRKVGETVAENPGTAGAIAAGAGLAAYVGNKIFRKPRTA